MLCGVCNESGSEHARRYERYAFRVAYMFRLLSPVRMWTVLETAGTALSSTHAHSHAWNSRSEVNCSDRAGHRRQTEATNRSCPYTSLPVGCDRTEMPFAAETSSVLPLDASIASARLAGPTGREVYIVGVSHTSPFYGSIVANAINAASPRHVVLEVCEVRSSIAACLCCLGYAQPKAQASYIRVEYYRFFLLARLFSVRVMTVDVRHDIVTTTHYAMRIPVRLDQIRGCSLHL